ncbi:N-acetyltransferase [Streptomyces sp. NPDC050416]|uniref:N-acetyltransferase n=1 Tax=Streptomyces sp. NPDC050416 TaxID=3365611 RepID=UPI0037B6ACD3
MPALEVRPFRRADRDQLTDLVNMHVAAVVPGVSVSVNTVLSDLERQPGEFITDPWVAERTTLVAEQREYVVAAAHLLRYRADAEVGEAYRDAAEINWFVCRPAASFWPDADQAADLLMRACLAQFARWNARVRYADGALPAPLVYGLPRNWPHIRAVYERAGFRHAGDTEVILIARVADLPEPEPRPGVTVERTLGECGTRFTARAGTGAPGGVRRVPPALRRPARPLAAPGEHPRTTSTRASARQAESPHRTPPGPPSGRTAGLYGHPLGFVEIDTALARPERHARAAGLADIGNLHIDPAQHGTGLEHWLLAQAADWLRLCGVDRLVAYESAADSTMLGHLTGAGFRELTRTDRGWEHRPG